MPYDKGDFTQQGIDGKVSGGLLLNNKRDVDVLVSSNEDDSTLGGVAVTIEDHLNDLKYAFFGENLEAGEVYEIGVGGDTRLVIPSQTINQTNDTPYAILSDIPDNITDFDTICLLLDNNFASIILEWDSDNSIYTGTDYKYNMTATLGLESDEWKISILNPDSTPITGELPILGVGLTESE